MIFYNCQKKNITKTFVSSRKKKKKFKIVDDRFDFDDSNREKNKTQTRMSIFFNQIAESKFSNHCIYRFENYSKFYSSKIRNE